MNEYNKSLKNIRNELKDNYFVDIEYTGIFDDLLNIKELVERATPKKIIDLCVDGEDCYCTDNASKCGHCPNCKEDTINFWDFCPYCGQALGWSDEE